MFRALVLVCAVAACSHSSNDDAPAPRHAHDADVDAGQLGQPLEEPLCRKAVENYAHLRALTLDAAQVHALTLWCLDGSAAVTTCMAAAQTLKDTERCDGLGADETSFGQGADSVASRPTAAECATAVAHLVVLVPEAGRDQSDFLRSCLAGTRAEMSCVKGAARPEDLTRCP